MGDISQHFDRREFDCHDGSKAHPTPDLLRSLERLRHLVGDKPLHIVSGYRSPTWNRRVGGASNSQHLWNRAADLRPGYCTVAQARAAGFSGIGVRAGRVVHVDVRPGAPVVFDD